MTTYVSDRNFMIIEGSGVEFYIRSANNTLFLRLFRVTELTEEEAKAKKNAHYAVFEFKGKYYDPVGITGRVEISSKIRKINWKTDYYKVTDTQRKKIEEIAKKLVLLNTGYSSKSFQNGKNHTQHKQKLKEYSKSMHKMKPLFDALKAADSDLEKEAKQYLVNEYLTFEHKEFKNYYITYRDTRYLDDLLEDRGNYTIQEAIDHLITEYKKNRLKAILG